MEPNDLLKRKESEEALKALLRRLSMGEIRAKLRLENLGDRIQFKAGNKAEKDIRFVEIEGVADTGAVVTLLPQEVVEALGLERIGRIIVSLADERKIELDRVGPLSLTVAGRNMLMSCLMGPPGCEPLIGQTVMEELDLIPDPVRRTLTVRPESPLVPTLKLKGLAVEALA